MAISYIGQGALATGTTSLTVAYPTGITSGDLLLMVVTSKATTTTGIVAPTGFATVIGTVNGAVTSGAGVGSIRQTVFSQVPVGSLSGSITVSVPTGAPSMARMYLYRKAAGDLDWLVNAGAGFDVGTANTTLVSSSTTLVPYHDNDVYMHIFSTPQNTLASAYTLPTATGSTFSAATELSDDVVATGNFLSQAVTRGTVSGRATGNVTAQTTTVASTTGMITFLRLGIVENEVATVYNNAEMLGASAAGTVVTTANTADAFNENFNFTQAVTTSKTIVAHGTTSYQHAATTGTAAQLQLSTDTLSWYLHTRAYVYLTGYPTAAIQWIRFDNVPNGTAGRLIMTTTGAISLQNNAGATQAGATTPVPLNQWVRQEAWVNVASGDVYYKAFLGDSTTEYHSLTFNTDGGNSVGLGSLKVGRVTFGKSVAGGNMATYYMDALAVGTGSPTPTYFGPAVTAVTLPFTETFTGTSGSPWGSAWDQSAPGGAGGSTSINASGQGVLTPNSSAFTQAPSMYLDGMPATADTEMYAEFGFDGTIAQQYLSFAFRSNGSYDNINGRPTNAYAAMLFPHSGNYNFAKYDAGAVETNMAVPTKTWVAGARYGIRISAVGPALKVKVWNLSGSEPAAWDAEVTDSTYTAPGKLMITKGNGSVALSRPSAIDNVTVSLPTATVIIPSGVVSEIETQVVSVTGSKTTSGLVSEIDTQTVVVTGSTVKSSDVSQTSVQTVSVTGATTKSGVTFVSANQTLTTTGSSPNAGAVSLVGTQTTALSGSTTKSGVVNAVGVHSVAVTGSVTKSGVTSTTSNQTITVSGSTTNSSSVSLIGTQTVEVSGSTPALGVPSGSVSQISTQVVTLQGTSQRSGSASAISSQSLVVSGSKISSGAVIASGTQSVVISGTRISSGSVVITSAQVTNVTGSTSKSGSTSVGGTQTITIQGYAPNLGVPEGNVSVVATAVINVSGSKVVSGSTSVTAQTSISLNGSSPRKSDVVLLGTALPITVSGSKRPSASVEVEVPQQVVLVDSSVVKSGSVELIGLSTITISVGGVSNAEIYLEMYLSPNEMNLGLSNPELSLNLSSNNMKVRIPNE